ncbi:MAG: ester cyclase [Armatimonadetes bacterium]|nr:ester cyclase [Armatimonadota bacterium]
MRDSGDIPRLVLCCVIAVVIVLATLSCQTETGGVVSEELAQSVATRYLEARNTADLDLLDDIYAQDVVVHDCSAPEDILGLDALKSFYAASHEGFPDLRVVFHDVLVSRDHIVFRGAIEGTHTGDLRGMPPTGRHVSFPCVAIDRIEGGKIVEEWVYFNVLDLLTQLGVSPPPPPTAGT